MEWNCGCAYHHIHWGDTSLGLHAIPLIGGVKWKWVINHMAVLVTRWTACYSKIDSTGCCV